VHRHPRVPAQVVAVLFSRFEEVLYLDSDNVALADPTGAPCNV
jgi:hypothetical protein